MSSENDYPTVRTITAEYETVASRPDEAAELTNLPWYDIHSHPQSLSWNDHEKTALSGCRGMIAIGSGFHWCPYRPIRSEDVRFLWDDALNRCERIERAHFFDVNIGIGVHSGARVEDIDALLEVMPSYCELDEVTAIGEIGVTQSQDVSRWEIDEQKAVVREQMRIGSDQDIPVIIHTPPNLVHEDAITREEMFGIQEGTKAPQEWTLEEEGSKLEGLKLDLACKDDAGLADELVVVSHADRDIAPYVMEHTDCYLSYTIGYPWLTGVTVETAAEAIEEYGPERIMIDTDNAGVVKSEFFAMKRAIFELYRRGIDVDSIKQVVHDNPVSVFEF